MNDSNQMQNMSPEAAVQYVQRIVQSTGISPQIFAHLGDLAERALEDKKFYDQLIKEIVDLGVAEKDELNPKFDYTLVVSMIVMGKAAERMVDQAGMTT